MKKHLIYLFHFIFILFAVACGISSNSGSSQQQVTEGIVGTYNTLNGAMEKFGSIVPERSVESLEIKNLQNKSIQHLSANAFGAAWDSIQLEDATQTGSPQVSLTDWLQVQLDPTSSRAGNDEFSPVGPLGRLEKSMEIFCIVGSIFPASGLDSNKNPIPRTEPYEFILTTELISTVNQNCGFDDGDDIAGLEFSVVVSAVTPNTVYDLELEITVVGGNTETLYMKNDEDYINFASLESNSSNNYGYRVTVQYDKASQITRMEYSAAEFTSINDDSATVVADSSNNLFRIFVDEGNNHAMIYFSEGSLLEGNSDHQIRKVLSGLLETEDQPFNLSFRIAGQNGATGEEDFRARIVADGMILQEDGAIDDLGVTGLGLAVPAQAGVNTTLASATWGEFKEIRKDLLLDFNLSTILTVPLVQLIP